MQGISSVGRAFEWHSKGQGFESPILHHTMKRLGEVAGGWVEKALFAHKKKAPLIRRAVFFSLPIYYIDM